MIIDKRLQLSDKQAVTADAASTDQIDLGQARKIAPGEPMWIVLQADVAADFTTGDETYEVQVQSDDDVAFGSPTVLFTRAILAAALTAGSRHVIPMPWTEVPERYLRLFYNTGGTSPSVTVTAWLTNQEPQSWEAQPDAI